MTTQHDIKNNLAYAYRVLAKLGMDDHTYTHLSAKPKGADYYYIYPFGYRFENVTADCLLKVGLNGEILAGEEKQYNKTGYVIHGNIYQNRKDLNAIFHLHTISSVAVSAMKSGLLPISQWALHFYGQVKYHDYNSLFLDNAQHGCALSKDLGNKKVIFLRNHGFVACGNDIPEAMFYCYHLEQACKTQIAALSCGMEIMTPTHEICIQANKDILSFEQNLGHRDWQAWLEMKI